MVVPHRKSIHIIVSITNTDKEILEWISEITGVGSVNVQYRETEKRSETWFYRCFSEAAETLLQQIRPHLKIKGEQAMAAIEVQSKLRDPSIRMDRQWQIEYVERVKLMNKRGPKVSVRKVRV